jgi:3-oxoacyl-[acyl-carrier protein] reductase
VEPQAGTGEPPTREPIAQSITFGLVRATLARAHIFNSSIINSSSLGGTMDLGIAGKNALVTGSTKGIGRAIAETLLAEGASVAICARTADDVDAAVAEMSALGTVVGSVCDAADAEAVRAWVTQSCEALGGIDIYVHNTSGKPARKLEAWINNFNIDLMSLVYGVDAAKEALADGGGSLISIGTTATAEHFASGSGSYSALKAAVTNWTLGQAQVLGAKGIRCNVVSPGPIFVEGGDWDNIKKNMAEFYAASQAVHPQGALGTTQDVADAVAFLVSERAAHVNGVNLTVDGGFLKRIDF